MVIRADATSTSGTGHVMRCWALAEEFEGRGFEIAWQSSIDVPWVMQALTRRGWQVHRPPDTPQHQALAVEAAAVVVDSYDLDLSYRELLLEREIAVVAIVDDFAVEAGPSSLWVNPGIATDLPVAQPDRFLNGPNYVLIRKEVAGLCALRESRRQSQEQFNGITFLLGGADSLGIGKAIRGLVERMAVGMSVYAGPAESHGSTITGWLPAGQELLRTAALSRLVVSAAGVTSWELAHIGVPFALMQVTENQSGNYKWMTDQGWAWPLGEGSELHDLDAMTERLLAAIRALADDPSPSRGRIDGLGAQRVVDATLSLL